MNKTSTELDIIKYIYNELNQQEKAQIKLSNNHITKNIRINVWFKKC